MDDFTVYTIQHNFDHDLLCSNFYAQTHTLHLHSIFATSRTPLSGAWSTDSRKGESEITVRVPYSRHFHVYIIKVKVNVLFIFCV